MPESNVELFRDLVRTWPNGDFSAWMRLFSEDVVLTGYMPEGVVTHHGRDAARRYLAEFSSMWTSYLVEVEDVTSLDDETVLVSGRQIGVGRSSGLEISEPAHNVNRLRDGRIVRTSWHVDRDKAIEGVSAA